DLSGTISLRARVSGNVRSPAAEIEGSVQNLLYRTESIGDLTFRAESDGRIATVRAESTRYSADPVANVLLSDSYPFEVTRSTHQSSIRMGAHTAILDGIMLAEGRFRPFKLDDIGFRNLHVSGEGVELSASGSLAGGVDVHGTAELAALTVPNVTLGGSAV